MSTTYKMIAWALVVVLLAVGTWVVGDVIGSLNRLERLNQDDRTMNRGKMP